MFVSIGCVLVLPLHVCVSGFLCLYLCEDQFQSSRRTFWIIRTSVKSEDIFEQKKTFFSIQWGPYEKVDIFLDGQYFHIVRTCKYF